MGPRTRQWPILTGGGSSAAASGKQRALPGMPRRGTEHGTVAGAGGLLSVHGKDRVPAEDRVSHVIVLVDTPQRIASGDWWTCPDDGRALRRDTASMRSPVLIVDDHDGFRAVARTLLESEGFDVVGEAADGGSAVVAAVALCPGVILLDVHLPDVDGFSVARQLAGLPERPRWCWPRVGPSPTCAGGSGTARWPCSWARASCQVPQCPDRGVSGAQAGRSRVAPTRGRASGPG